MRAKGVVKMFFAIEAVSLLGVKGSAKVLQLPSNQSVLCFQFECDKSEFALIDTLIRLSSAKLGQDIRLLGFELDSASSIYALVATTETGTPVLPEGIDRGWISQNCEPPDAFLRHEVSTNFIARTAIEKVLISNCLSAKNSFEFARHSRLLSKWPANLMYERGSQGAAHLHLRESQGLPQLRQDIMARRAHLWTVWGVAFAALIGLASLTLSALQLWNN
jgi:hypothetical protein